MFVFIQYMKIFKDSKLDLYGIQWLNSHQKPRELLFIYYPNPWLPSSRAPLYFRMAAGAPAKSSTFQTAEKRKER